jgi:hypothetical protein
MYTIKKKKRKTNLEGRKFLPSYSIRTMKNNLTAKYLGYQGGTFKFQDDTQKIISFGKCNRDLIGDFELLSKKNVNRIFKICFIHFKKEEVKIINEMILV